MSTELAELNAVVAEFPPELVRKVLDYAISLKQPYWERPGYSSEWTDEDIQDAMKESMRQSEAEHAGEDWGQQPYTPGYK